VRAHDHPLLLFSAFGVHRWGGDSERDLSSRLRVLTLNLGLRFRFDTGESGRMRIGELAVLAGVPAATVRYYERRGLIAEPARTRSGYREYGAAAAERIRFIKRAQDLGFSLEEVEELLDLRVHDQRSCAPVAEKTRRKIADVRRRIAELERLEAVLAKLADACAARARTSECPVLEMLTEELRA
jgi:MerR family transcriptional regulator, copper efflux regulator